MGQDEDQDGGGYMLYHSVGQYAGKSQGMAAAMAEFAEAWSSIEGGHWPYALGLVGRYLARWRDLIGAPENSVTSAENVTSALSALINALPEDALRGRAVLVAEDCFPSNHFLLAGLAGRLGFSLRTVRLRQGATWVEDEDFVSHWTPDVGLALLTWVSSVSSHKCDLAALAAHGRKIGSLIGVDITQAAGLLPFDVNAPAVDFAISTSLKWLCGTPGAGMLYVAPSLIPSCAPPLRGWFSQPDPFNWDITRFAYAPDIRRFDSGTPSVMACAATLPALDWHAGQDMAAMRARNLRLCEDLQSAVKALGIRLASPADPAQRGGSIMLQLDGPAMVKNALQALEHARVQADGRGRVLRLSPGNVTNGHGVERVLDVLRRLKH
jgi:selenocysteine lyase/cysteine desulfurase